MFGDFPGTRGLRSPACASAEEYTQLRFRVEGKDRELRGDRCPETALPPPEGGGSRKTPNSCESNLSDRRARLLGTGRERHGGWRGRGDAAVAADDFEPVVVDPAIACGNAVGRAVVAVVA